TVEFSRIKRARAPASRPSSRGNPIKLTGLADWRQTRSLPPAPVHSSSPILPVVRAEARSPESRRDEGGGRSPRGREPGLSGLAPRRSVATERTLRSAPGARKSAPAPPGGHYAFVQVKGVFTDQTAANHTGGVRRPPCRPDRRSARRR